MGIKSIDELLREENNSRRRDSFMSQSELEVCTLSKSGQYSPLAQEAVDEIVDDSSSQWGDTDEGMNTGVTHTIKVSILFILILSRQHSQVVVIGDAGVGKTSLIHQLTKKQ